MPALAKYMFTFTALVVSSELLGAVMLQRAMQVIALVCPTTAPPTGAPVVVLVNTKSGTVIGEAVTSVLFIIIVS